MQSIEGVVILTQESRFQLLDDDGVAHLFVLSYSASADSHDLPALQKHQARVRVGFSRPPGSPKQRILARVADRIDLCLIPAQES